MRCLQISADRADRKKLEYFKIKPIFLDFDGLFNCPAHFRVNFVAFSNGIFSGLKEGS